MYVKKTIPQLKKKMKNWVKVKEMKLINQTLEEYKKESENDSNEKDIVINGGIKNKNPENDVTENGIMKNKCSENETNDKMVKDFKTEESNCPNEKFDKVLSHKSVQSRVSLKRTIKDDDKVSENETIKYDHPKVLTQKVNVLTKRLFIVEKERSVMILEMGNLRTKNQTLSDLINLNECRINSHDKVNKEKAGENDLQIREIAKMQLRVQELKDQINEEKKLNLANFKKSKEDKKDMQEIKDNLVYVRNELSMERNERASIIVKYNKAIEEQELQMKNNCSNGEGKINIKDQNEINKRMDMLDTATKKVQERNDYLERKIIEIERECIKEQRKSNRLISENESLVKKFKELEKQNIYLNKDIEQTQNEMISLRSDMSENQREMKILRKKVEEDTTSIKNNVRREQKAKRLLKFFTEDFDNLEELSVSGNEESVRDCMKRALLLIDEQRLQRKQDKNNKNGKNTTKQNYEDFNKGNNKNTFKRGKKGNDNRYDSRNRGKGNYQKNYYRNYQNEFYNDGYNKNSGKDNKSTNSMNKNNNETLHRDISTGSKSYESYYNQERSYSYDDPNKDNSYEYDTNKDSENESSRRLTSAKGQMMIKN